MNIIPYELATTNDLLTSRAGLITIAQLMKSIGFSQIVDLHFPQPNSNRGFKPSLFVNSTILMLHEGGACLDDLRYIREDKALCRLLGIKKIPEADSMGDWLRRIGQIGVTASTEVNRYLIQTTLGYRKDVTLDIDATLSASKNRNAAWTYKKCTGYMPMVGHLAETGQIVATDFREGNTPPSANNLEFIHQCEAALPLGVKVTKLRIDAAGYQVAIVDECIDRGILFAIRAKMNAGLKRFIEQQSEEAWQPLQYRDEQESTEEATCRLVHTMEKSQHAFTVVIQRKKIRGQIAIDFEDDNTVSEVMQKGEYLYRAIATNREELTDSELVHWYNQRAEHSENRIKELKLDFGAERMPCADFDANALYFSLCSLAYNLFALMRTLLPKQFESSRAKTIRWRLYALAGKVVMHGRRLYLKVKAAHKALIAEVLISLSQLAQAP
jgi:hypothetical protein